MYCKNCGGELNANQEVCLNCGVKVGEGNGFCANCGKPVNPGAAVCLSCGAALNTTTNKLNGQDKIAMGVLALFLGGLGIHNFMMGETKKGIFKIVTSLCFGIGAIFALIDAIRIFTDNYVADPTKLI